MDILALKMDIQCLAVIAFAFAYITGHIDIGQKVHLYFGNAIALTGFTAAALHIKAKSSRVVAAGARLLGAGKKLPHRGEDTGVGGGVGARCAANRALVNINAFIQMAEASDLAMSCGL